MDIRTVAIAAGVSVATVSRVMNKLPTVDPQLSKKVWEAVHTLGYVDDIKITEYMLPPMTTIRMSGRDIAASAVYALLNPGTAPKQVETGLIVRQTTGVAPKRSPATKPGTRKTTANTSAVKKLTKQR